VKTVCHSVRRVLALCAGLLIASDVGYARSPVDSAHDRDRRAQSTVDDTSPRPAIAWMPSSVTETLFAGDTDVVRVTFTPSKNIRRVSVEVSPPLAAFVRPDVMTVDRLRRGEPRQVNLIFAVPATASSATLTGSVALARVDDDELASDGDGDGEKLTLADALQVTLTIQRRTVANAEWSTFQHDSQHTGRSPYVGPVARANLSPLFDVTAIGGAMEIAPDHRILVGGNRLLALNPDGTVDFDLAIPLLPTAFGLSRAVIETLTIASDGSVFATVFGLDFPNTGGMYAFNHDGSLQWQRDFGGVPAAVTIGLDGTVYTTTFSGQPGGVPCRSQLIALARDDGHQLWAFDYGGCWVPNPPAIAPDGTVLVSGFGVGLLIPTAVNAHDPVTGALLWTLDLGRHFVTPPSVSADGTVYFATDRVLFAASSLNGQIRWVYAYPEIVEPSPPSITADGGVTLARVFALGLFGGPQKFAILDSFTPDGVLKFSVELAPSAALAPCQASGPHVALDANANAFVSFSASCEDGSATAPLIFGVSANGVVNWTVDGFISLPAIVGAPDTVYVIGILGVDRTSVPLYRITSQ